MRRPRASRVKYGSVAAARSRGTQIRPLYRPVFDAPAPVGIALEIDLLFGVALLSGAATTAVAIGAGVEHRDDDRLVPGAQAEVVELEPVEVGECSRNVVGGDP